MNVRVVTFSKQVLLTVSVVYFYVTALALGFDWNLPGLYRPMAFAVMGIIFMLALGLEAALVWWHKRKRVLWITLGLVVYAMIGFVVAPELYGEPAVWVALFLPLATVFLGGFLWTYAVIFRRAFASRKTLPTSVVLARLAALPGWDYIAGQLVKTYRFATPEASQGFVEQAHVAGTVHFRTPHLERRGSDVRVKLWTPNAEGVTEQDVRLAKALDAL